MSWGRLRKVAVAEVVLKGGSREGTGSLSQAQTAPTSRVAMMGRLDGAQLISTFKNITPRCMFADDGIHQELSKILNIFSK